MAGAWGSGNGTNAFPCGVPCDEADLAVGITTYNETCGQQNGMLIAAATNDLTDFFRGSAFVDGASNLVAGPEVRVTQVPDPHCASGWPCATDRITDSEGCTVQPQPAGVCKIIPIPNPDTASNARCDFSDCGTCSAGLCAGTATPCASDATCPRDPSCGCPAAENCRNGSGCPKYGDYNYSACAAPTIS